MKIGSLFSGYGGLEMGVQAALGGDVAWHVEFDAAPSKVLAHHWPDVPNYGDVSAVDFAAVEPIDVLTGGFPCQDVSLAGARRGMRAGTRSGLWSEFARAINTLRPGLVVIENVRGLLSAEAHSDMEPCTWCVGDEPDFVALRALGAVLGDLAELGYDARWCGLRAADAGAPHGRYRIFILAHPAGQPWSFGDGDDVPARGGAVRRLTASGRGPSADTSDDDSRRGAGTRKTDRGPRISAPNSDGLGHPGKLSVRPAAEVSAATGAAADTNDSAGHGERARPESLEGSEAVADSGRVRGGARRSPAPGQAPVGRSHGVAHGRGGEPTTDADGAGFREFWGEQSLKRDADRRRREDAAGNGGEPASPAADSTGSGRDGGTQEPLGLEVGRDASPGSGDAAGIWGQYAPAVERWGAVLGRPAPHPVRYDGRSGAGRLNPELTEWMMGLPAGHVTSPEIGLTRAQQLKACGNGVVPQQSELAVRYLVGAETVAA